MVQRIAIATPLLRRILSRTLSNNPKYAKNDTATTAIIGKEVANIISTLASFFFTFFRLSLFKKFIPKNPLLFKEGAPSE